MRTLPLMIVCAAALTGCVVPLPRMVQETPSVSGILTDDGAPVEGARVSVLPRLLGGECRLSDISAVTDTDGRFLISGTREAELYVVIGGDRLIMWGLCIESEAGLVAGWTASGLGYPPAQIELSCDLSAEPTVSREGSGICRIQE